MSNSEEDEEEIGNKEDDLLFMGENDLEKDLEDDAEPI